MVIKKLSDPGIEQVSTQKDIYIWSKLTGKPENSTSIVKLKSRTLHGSSSTWHHI